MLYVRSMIKFGGVPTGVAIPPIDAAYAMPSNKHGPNPRATAPDAPSAPGAFRFSRLRIASAIGNIMMAVAVFEIHIDSTAAESIKPSTRCAGRPPASRMIFRAMRRCKCQRSIASASKKPPRNKKIVELMYAPAIAPPDAMPSSGNNARGNSAVAARGTASVSHHSAIHTATAAADVTAGRAGSRSANSNTAAAATGPAAMRRICQSDTGRSWRPPGLLQAKLFPFRSFVAILIERIYETDPARADRRRPGAGRERGLHAQTSNQRKFVRVLISRRGPWDEPDTVVKIILETFRESLSVPD